MGHDDAAKVFNDRDIYDWYMLAAILLILFHRLSFFFLFFLPFFPFFPFAFLFSSHTLSAPPPSLLIMVGTQNAQMDG